jgi:hypothetical protein
MAVRIKKEARGYKAEAEWLPRRAQRHLRALAGMRVPGAAALKTAELSIVLTSDEGIRTLFSTWIP